MGFLSKLMQSREAQALARGKAEDGWQWTSGLDTQSI